MASVFVLLEAFTRKEAAALGFFPCATASWCDREDSNLWSSGSESADGITFAADGKATVTVEQFELNL